ncbi:MAG: 1-deoxy-D-xylulose-5-phosphate reductoisomerase [Spiroplasma sp.]|nr:1-deoxy-D-xylulose-5-phosphate reductoisomerase [Mycoplasmatales bacterium]
MKKIALTGASGSIGKQTIKVIEDNPHEFELVAVAVGGNVGYLNNLILQFPSIKVVSVKSREDLSLITCSNIEVYYGEEGLEKVATYYQNDLLISAVVGAVGLKSTISAIENRIDIGLANKETLVTAGHIIMPLAKQMGVNIYPIDSEHSAIFQCLNGEHHQEINKLILTASGGSFRDLNRNDLAHVTKEQALDHPNWKMGPKITIDSATMFNKGLEIIEAHHLFNIDYDDIEVLIHRESIIHSMVEFCDYSVIAQLGTPDMKVPIQYAMTYPKRLVANTTKRLNLSEIGKLNFSNVDLKRYPAVRLAYEAGKTGGSMPTVLNAANEVAVELFLRNKITFIEIEQFVEEQMANHEVISFPTLEQILEIDKHIRTSMQRK